MIAAMIGIPRPPSPAGFDVRADWKQPQSRPRRRGRRPPISTRSRMPRGSHGSPCSMALANASVVASISSHVVATVEPELRGASRTIARAVGAPSGAAGSHACLMTFGVFPSTGSSYTCEPCSTRSQHARVARQEADRQHDRGEDRAADEHRLRAGGLGQRAGQQVADRQQGERAHPLPGARAGQRVRRDPLGHRGVPEHVEQREADPGGDGAAARPSATGAPSANYTIITGHDRDHRGRPPASGGAAASGSRSARRRARPPP